MGDVSAGPDLSPVARWLLGRALREARQAACLTQGQAAAGLRWGLSKVIRLESGQSGMAVADLRAFLSVCGMTDETQAGRLAALAQCGRQRWRHRGHDVFAGGYAARLYLSCELSAASVTGHRIGILPARFQTVGYARALPDALRGTPSSRQAAAPLEERFARAAPAVLAPGRWTLDEACLCRPVGGEAVWRHQLLHLRDMITSQGADIRVIPFEAGVDPGWPGPFTLFDLGGPGECLAFVGMTGTEAVQGDADQVAELRHHAGRLAGEALSVGESAEFLSRLADGTLAAARRRGVPVLGPRPGVLAPEAPGLG